MLLQPCAMLPNGPAWTKPVALERLHEIRTNRVLEARHRAGRAQLAGRDGTLVLPRRGADDDPRQPLLEILWAGRERENGHHFARRDDDEMLLARNTVADAAEADHHVTERAVVHVDRARPGDAARIDVERVALLQVIVEHRREQRVRARDRVEVAGEVEIDVVHRHDLRVAAAGSAALHAEHRAEAGFANAERDFLLHAPERLRESDGDGALPFAGRRGIRRRDDDEAAADRTLRDLERDLRLVLAVEIELVALEPELGGDVLDRTHFDFLRDFDIRRDDRRDHSVRSW